MCRRVQSAGAGKTGPAGGHGSLGDQGAISILRITSDGLLYAGTTNVPPAAAPEHSSSGQQTGAGAAAGATAGSQSGREAGARAGEPFNPQRVQQGRGGQGAQEGQGSSLRGGQRRLEALVNPTDTRRPCPTGTPVQFPFSAVGQLQVSRVRM